MEKIVRKIVFATDDGLFQEKTVARVVWSGQISYRVPQFRGAAEYESIVGCEKLCM
jgi:hypothetical protein